MSTLRYQTSITLCEDTSQNYELYDLLRQADPNYSETAPSRITLYVLQGSTWTPVSGPGMFTAVDMDTFTVDMSYLPNFNGVQQLRVLGTDASGNTFNLYLTVNVTPVNDAPSGADETVAVANGDTYVLGLADFGFSDPVEHDSFLSVLMTTVPASGTLLLNGVAVVAGQEILASDIDAGKLSYVAPANAGGLIGFDFQVRDSGGTAGCGGNDLDLTPNTITFNVPSPSTAVIGDRVWEDTNGNGIQDDGEAGIAGVLVTLKDANGAPVATTTTDGSGNYHFTVNAGTYSVAVTAPTGYRVTQSDMGPSDATDSDIDDAGNSPLVTVAAGESNNTIDAGLFRSAEIGDRVWLDTNGNGQQDGGEAGVAGVVVRLYNANGDLVDGPVATDTNGNYLFTDLRPGTYSVQFDKTTLPAGYSFTSANVGSDVSDSDANPADGKTVQTVLDSGESDKTWDAGLVANPGAITGTVLEDLDHNGTGDTPIAGVTVVLKDPLTNTVIQTTTTDANGNYSFNNVPVGNYVVEESNKPGFTDVSDSDGGNPNSIAVTVTPGATSGGNVFIDERLPGAISGTVREDLDNNNTGDTPIAGVTVVLKGADGTPIATTTTDANGNYSFTGVPAGSYTVEETNKPGYTDVGDSDGGNPNSIAVVLQPGQSSTGNDFVDERPATLGDRVWLDTNANGVQDAGEAGIAGVTVVLKNADGSTAQTTTTDSTGAYSFTVTPGTYSVAVQTPNGYVVTGQHTSGNDATDSDVNAAGQSGQVTLQSGQNNPNVDAGLYQLAELGDHVWFDTNGNGQQDGGEAGVAGVKVTLLDASGNPVGASLTTDANGNYLFTGLKPGTYSVQFDKTTLPAGYSFTSANVGSDVSDSDANPADGKTVQTVLDSGESDKTWDAGIYQATASYGDRVWLDKNANGVQDAGEVGLAGVTVKLLNAAGTVVATTTTDTSGNYLFSNLTPGDYAAQVVAPSGYFVSAKDQGGNDGLDSDIDPTTGKTILTTLTAGETDLSWDAGLYQKASIGDKVWGDCNNNGIQDGAEFGVVGVTVKLLDASGAVVATTLTDANGNYVFKDLMPGTYSVQVVAPAGYSFTTSNVGTNDAIDSDVIASTVPSGTNLIVNGSFESGATGWTGVGDSIEVNAASCFGVSGATGTYVAELDANTAGSNTGFYQNVATVAGQTYQLSVDLALRSGTAASTNTVEVWWEGSKIATIDPTSTTLTKYTFNVVAQDASSRVEFREQAGDNDSVGGIIDNVRLVASGAVVGTTAQTYLESGENDMSWDAGLTAPVVSATFDFSGNSSTCGTLGNILCFSNNGISVNASAFSRDKGTGAWSSAYLGAYGGGLGVTDSSEGYGYGNTHTVDNNGTRDNYVMFEFSQSVVVDKAYLGYVVGDSDAKVWIGTVNGAFDTHVALTDAVLTSLGFTEVNATTLTSARWADINANGLAGNVLVVAANPGETDDYFKIQNLVVSTPSAFCATDVSIGDKVWYDANANGVQDAGEAGIAGVTVKLLNSAGVAINTTTTDANGNYLFDKLPAGDYKIQVVTPTGYVITTKDASVATDATDSDIDANGITGVYSLASGNSNLTVDAGFYKPMASIGDKVWVDCNKNGIQDAGETGYCGATVKLLDVNGTVVATTTTDANGNYKFSSLVPGDYSVQVVAPTGYGFTAKDQGSNDAVDSDVDVTTGKTVATTLVAGENDMTWDAGIFCKPSASIGDRVWEDMNYNGIQDAGEAGIKGVTVKLLNGAGAVVATTTTDANGSYLFGNLDAGSYKVQVVTPTGYYVTKQNQAGWNGTDSAFNSSGYTGTITLADGQALTKVDGGLYRKASIGDKVWEDVNHNNLQDAGEAGIANVKVWLWDNAAQCWSQSTYTDANGNYKFVNLDPGTYQICFDKSATYYKGIDMSRWYWAAKDVGTDDSRDADAYSTSDYAYTAYTTLVSGEADMTWDAAITPIVLDLDHNGIQTIAREDSTGKFDLFGNGKAINSGWISSGDAFLAIDINHNGKVDNLSELFGGTSKGDGFAKLAAFDSNGDGVVDAKDAHFADLRVWQDLNGNHQTDAGEMRTLAEAGVTSLKVDHVDLPAVDAQGNLHLERSSAVMADGSSIDMADVYFNVSVADAKDAGVELPNLASLLGDDRSLDHVLGNAVSVGDAAATAAAPAVVSDAATAGLAQLSHLYEEQQYALMAA